MFLTALLTGGLLLVYALIIIVCIRYWNVRLTGSMPVSLLTFIAILFTSGLDVGLIMFPLTEFPVYADTVSAPEYGFSNPLAIELGFWGFLIWSFYFLTSFYFCLIEPRVKFFENPVVKIVNNIIIIGTCAFTAALFIRYLPWYAGEIGFGDGESNHLAFYVIAAIMILLATISSTHIRYVKILSLASVVCFIALIIFMYVAGGIGLSAFGSTLVEGLDYFPSMNHFLLPINDYHAFYLFWWFAWSIMIGQFTSRFIGGLKTYQILLALLFIPSIPLLIWFSVLYNFYMNEIVIGQLKSFAMVTVGILFVINSLDSLIRLYTDNLNLTRARFGTLQYVLFNWIALSLLALLFVQDWLQIQWVGSIVIVLYAACLAYIMLKKRDVWNITESVKWDSQ